MCRYSKIAETLAVRGFQEICAKCPFLIYIPSPCVAEKYEKSAESLGGLGVGMIFDAF